MVESAKRVERIDPSTECKVCGGTCVPSMVRNGYQIVKCAECGFRFAPLQSGFDQADVYRDDEYWNGGRDYGYAPNYDEEWKAWASTYRARLGRIARLQRPGRMIEIGCAAGYFLKDARSRGWTVEGVELSPMMRQRAQALLGCTIYNSLDPALGSGQRYDCAVMYEVIEHHDRPREFLSDVRKLIRPGGILSLSTCNFEGFDAEREADDPQWFAPPAHVSYFGPETLRRCAETAGFEVLAMEGVVTSELPMPPTLERALSMIRKGRRLRPRGLLGKIIKGYQLRHADPRYWRAMELYARNPGNDG